MYFAASGIVIVGIISVLAVERLIEDGFALQGDMSTQDRNKPVLAARSDAGLLNALRILKRVSAASASRHK